MRPGVWQLLIVLLIIILLFGARRLPELARSLGESLKVFKSSVRDEDAASRGATDGSASADPVAGPSRGPVEGAPRPSGETAPDTTPPADAAPPRSDTDRGPAV